MVTSALNIDLDAREKMYSLIERLYPLCRSITGNGLRESLQIIQGFIPLEIHEVVSGTEVFDWTIPKEWNINNAWIKNEDGVKIIDFNDSNLHVLNYSIPVNKKVGLDELKNHVYTLPDQPDLIPYRTSYYNEKWGFCITQNQLDSMNDEGYYVCIESTLQDGSLSYGELLIEGESQEEVLISSHICHPSLVNDNLSGVAVAVHLAEWLMKQDLHYSYRFLFIPATIGSITWLAHNENKVQNIKHGLVLSCVGDDGCITYKKSRMGKAEIDQVVEQVLVESTDEHEIRDFSPYGYDERQYCSPAFDLPVGCFMRTPFGEFSEYHTSADNLDFVNPEKLADSLSKLKQIAEVLEGNGMYLNINPQCEPNLGKVGLYKLTGGSKKNPNLQQAILWVLNFSDGNHTLLDIAKRSGLNFRVIKQASVELERVQLLKRLY